jgi:hypothetical protein
MIGYAMAMAFKLMKITFPINKCSLGAVTPSLHFRILRFIELQVRLQLGISRARGGASHAGSTIVVTRVATHHGSTGNPWERGSVSFCEIRKDKLKFTHAGIWFRWI